jgi:hypothetical protein
LSTVRVYKVAELLNTTSQEVLALLKKAHGIELKSASSTLEEIVARQFVDRLAKQRNITLPKGDIFSEQAVKVTQHEVPMKVACDIHPFMAMHVCVVDHPFYAVTDAAGKFEMKNLPPGNYVLGVWHEKLEAPDQNIVVKEDLKAEFTLKLK